MSPAERRAVLGDDLVATIHRDVDAELAAYGIPADAIADLRAIFSPVLERLGHPGATQMSEAA